MSRRTFGGRPPPQFLADLSRTGQHPEFGEVRLGQLLATWVVHDLNHMGLIVRTMAKVYADAVGPWAPAEARSGAAS